MAWQVGLLTVRTMASDPCGSSLLLGPKIGSSSIRPGEGGGALARTLRSRCARSSSVESASARSKSASSCAMPGGPNGGGGKALLIGLKGLLLANCGTGSCEECRRTGDGATGQTGLASLCCHLPRPMTPELNGSFGTFCGGVHLPSVLVAAGGTYVGAIAKRPVGRSLDIVVADGGFMGDGWRDAKLDEGLADLVAVVVAFLQHDGDQGKRRGGWTKARWRRRQQE